MSASRARCPLPPVGNPVQQGSVLERAVDLHAALRIFAQLCPHSDTLRFITIHGSPKSKARPRLGRHGTYQPDTLNQQALAWRLRESFGSFRLTGAVAVGAIFYRPNRQRIDADNMMKLVMDAATGVVWKDDCQVTAQLAIVELDPQKPRTVLVFGEHDSSMNRDKDKSRVCRVCGITFAAPWSGSRQIFCGRACKAAAVTQQKLRPGRGKG